MPNVQGRLALAEHGARKAIEELTRLRMDYETERGNYWQARVKAINAKIDALQAVASNLNPNAHPWAWDEVSS